MQKYLFRFGFCTPLQWRQNEANGWDDESSESVFIEAETVDAAESWGCEIAEAFCRRLFELASWTDDIPSWKEARFAYWIEIDATALPSDYLQKIPVVREGEFPDFGSWEQMDSRD